MLSKIRKFIPKKYDSAPTVDQLIKDPTVHRALRKAWRDSKPNAPDIPFGSSGSLKSEQGGWIIWNKKTRRVEIERVPGGTRDGLATISGTRPEGTSDRQVVGWFHTHPNKNSEGYRTGPGIGNIRFTHAEARVPGIIETHDGRIIIPYP